MNSTHQFDVLVVYSQGIAASASTTNNDIMEPFLAGSTSESYNIAYAEFLKACERKKLRVAFTTSADIVSAGTCRSYWLYKNNMWIKVKNACYAPLIFDKFSPVNKKRIAARLLLFSTSDISAFNDSYLLDLFYDKHKTFELLEEFSIPTVVIKNASKREIRISLKNLKELMISHIHKNDFSSEVILKDRNGAGGDQIYKLSRDFVSEIAKCMRRNALIRFVLQPYVNFDTGFIYQEKPRLTDIRLVFMREKLIQTYIRMAEKEEFRCNEHRGGTLEYIKRAAVPKEILQMSKKIIKKINTKSSLYALDFIISNNGNVFLLEGNTGPGLDWNVSKKANEKKSKELIGHIVKDLLGRTRKYDLGNISVNSLDSTNFPIAGL